MNVLIIGGGAIGCLVAARLIEGQGTSEKPRTEVTLVGRQRLVEAAEKNGGIEVYEDHQTRIVPGITVAASVADAYQNSKAFDVAIFTVKSYDTAAAAQELTEAISHANTSQPMVVSLQNGVGNEQALEAAGFDAITAGSITTPVSILDTGRIRVDKSDSEVGLAAWPDGATTSKAARAESLFRSGGFETTVFDSANSLKWTKLLMNMMTNASSAALDLPAPEVFADRTLANREIDAWREALSVMRAADITPINLGSYPFTIFAPLIRWLPRLIIRPILRKRIVAGRGNKMPSLHIDFHKPNVDQPQTEVEWLNGAIVRLGAQVGVDTPINRELTNALTSQT